MRRDTFVAEAAGALPPEPVAEGCLVIGGSPVMRPRAFVAKLAVLPEFAQHVDLVVHSNSAISGQALYLSILKAKDEYNMVRM